MRLTATYTAYIIRRFIYCIHRYSTGYE